MTNDPNRIEPFKFSPDKVSISIEPFTSTYSLFSLCCEKDYFDTKKNNLELPTTGKRRVDLNRGFSALIFQHFYLTQCRENVHNKLLGTS